MPTFDVVFLVRKMNQDGLKKMLSRTAKYVIEAGGVLRKMENFGYQTLPYAVSTGTKRERSAHFFIFNYTAGFRQSAEIIDKFRRDLDVIKQTNLVESTSAGHLLNDEPKPECTLHIDMLPAPLRPSVLEIIKKGEKEEKRKLRKKKFKYNTGMDYTPF